MPEFEVNCRLVEPAPEKDYGKWVEVNLTTTYENLILTQTKHVNFDVNDDPKEHLELLEELKRREAKK